MQNCAQKHCIKCAISDKRQKEKESIANHNSRSGQYKSKQESRVQTSGNGDRKINKTSKWLV